MARRLPKVTIAIPTFNRLRYLRQAIGSALAQSYPELEVIVSDNNSDDGTAEALESISDPRLIFLRQSRNLGMIGNWNACLERATGELFLLLSDDDYLEQKAIERLVEAIVNAPESDTVGVAYCRTWVVGPDNNKLGLGSVPCLSEEALDFALGYFEGHRALYPASTMMRTEDLRSVGGYAQGSVTLAADAMAFSRVLLKRGVIAGVPDALAYYRQHPASVTSTTSISTWQTDIKELIALWSAGFGKCSAGRRKRFLHAAKKYESSQIAMNINRSVISWRSGIRLIASYWTCRDSFIGIVGIRNCLVGMMTLIAPEFLKRPVRTSLLLLQEKGTDRLLIGK